MRSAASRTAKLPRAFWDWEDMLSINEKGFFPYTPSTNLMYGLDVALDMLHEEGLENVWARHQAAGDALQAGEGDKRAVVALVAICRLVQASIYLIESLEFETRKAEPCGADGRFLSDVEV